MDVAKAVGCILGPCEGGIISVSYTHLTLPTS